MRKRRRIPGICYHKGTQRWFVHLDGHAHYLSGRLPRTPTPPFKVQAEYDCILARWLNARAVMPEPVAADPTLDELWLGYLIYIRQGPKYKKNGKPTSEVYLIECACRVAARLFGTEPARDFGPLKLEQVRAEFQKAGWTRETINKAVHRVKRLFRWGVSRELLPEHVWRSLQAVPDLTAAEHPHVNKKVADVADDVLEATASKLPTRLAAMVRLHRLIGCRAQEIVVARTCDFDQQADHDGLSERCWLYTPIESKTGESYWIGPAAQAILTPLLRPDRPTAWLFPTRRRGKGCWTTSSYRRRIARCCAQHNLPHWSPINVRHAAAEEARQKHPAGLEATQARLRHKEMQVSQKYAWDLSALGRDVARQLG